jgi:hypothetical protein
VLEEIMRVERADIRDDDHGMARIEIALAGASGCQSAVYPVNATIGYNLLQLFGVEYLSEAKGKPVVVLRDEPGGLIKGLGSLPCDPWIEVMR